MYLNTDPYRDIQRLNYRNVRQVQADNSVLANAFKRFEELVYTEI